MPQADFKITYITHASIKIESKFGSLLTDPWILNEPIYAMTTWKFPAAIIKPEEIVNTIDYLYFSHPHEDHFHIPSIDCFPRDIKIILAEFPDFNCLRSYTMERTLREMGFHNIIKMMPWETIDLGEGEKFTLIPACKMKYWDWENSGFVLEIGDFKLLNMNDCPSDKELYEKVDEKFGEIDLAFIQYSGVSMFPGCYRMSREEMFEASKVRKHSWIQQKNLIEYLKVKNIAPFAGDFSWLSDNLFHCNIVNRSTPKLFSDFVANNYPDKNINVVIMYPTDTWDINNGLIRNHPEIDWDNYVELIAKLKDKLQNKVKAVDDWINSSNLQNLKERSIEYTNHIQKWLNKYMVDFTTRVKFTIEGPNSNFSFVIKANPKDGVQYDWNDAEDVQQTLFVREEIWASVLESKLLLTNLQWACENEQHTDFVMDLARFWFWFENFMDLNNRNAQALIDRALFPEIKERIRPQFGVFPQKDEWNLIDIYDSKKENALTNV
ncbi:MAG: MBL fold metallo-hydrolase [Sphingobacteriia bacterium]|nr:MBL fold metallo-hydrolase [Sphingobacteriia bacterium]